MTDKEQIMIDGVDILKEKINMCFILLLNKLETPETIEQTIYEHLDTFVRYWNAQLARKTQECEKLEDFRTLTREVFTFGDSDVDDENFIKYLQEYSRSYEEAIDGYYRLTDITGIDYTVHGGADIEEIIKRVDILKQECEELKKANQHIDTNRQCKGSKLKRIEELISDCETGYTDEFIQKIYGIIQEPEPTVNDYSITDRYRKALEEIEDFRKKHCDFLCEGNRILDIINKAKGENNGINDNSK